MPESSIKEFYSITRATRSKNKNMKNKIETENKAIEKTEDKNVERATKHGDYAGEPYPDRTTSEPIQGNPDKKKEPEPGEEGAPSVDGE